jgi:hypothetical protein
MPQHSQASLQGALTTVGLTMEVTLEVVEAGILQR